MIRPNVACPNCKAKGGVKEYMAVDYDKPKTKGRPRKAETRRSCPVCKSGWFVRKGQKQVLVSN